MMDEDFGGDAEGLQQEHDHDQHSTDQTPQEYRRQELEYHASSGKPIIRDPRLSTLFLKRLIMARGLQLTKLRIHGIVSTMEQVRLVCEGCPNLQDVVLQLFEDEKVRYGERERINWCTNLNKNNRLNSASPRSLQGNSRNFFF